ncbi:hypothetical protein [Oryzihumus sp.]
MSQPDGVPHRRPTGSEPPIEPEQPPPPERPVPVPEPEPVPGQEPPQQPTPADPDADPHRPGWGVPTPE